MVPSTASLPASQAKAPPSRRSGNNTVNSMMSTNTNTSTSTSTNTVTSTATSSTVKSRSTRGVAAGTTTDNNNNNNNNNNSNNSNNTSGGSKPTTAATPTPTMGISTTSRRYRASGCRTPDGTISSNNNSSSSNNNNNNNNTTDSSGNHNSTVKTNTNDPKMMVTAATTISSSISTKNNNNNNNNNSNNSMMMSGPHYHHHHHHHPNHRHSRYFHHRHHIQDILERDDDSDGNDDVADYDVEEEDEEEEEEEHNIRLCLHCKSEKTNKADIQVRCDECTAYICDDCHWCHEYQANHEIRVCDRCDGFYCRHCDEMDQCDDCHEVVCTSCSTLLSCKFCGGGLCEDCATACGRCGIVLCSRDSKFAVECDTCRLSYCLVCLASGSKDACVRCGSRPSKRMEQLVHLRLKSIYKAFKQNSAAPSYHMNGKYNNNPNPSTSARSGGGGRHHPQRLNDALDFGGPDDPDVLFQAVKISEAAASSMYANAHKNSSSNGNNERISSSNRSSGANTTLSVADRASRFKEEKERADAAAAALLAELDEEEEENEKSKNKKKKKKKSKQPQQPSPNNDSNNNNNTEGNKTSANGSYVHDDDDDDDDGSSLEYISNIVLAKGEHVDSKPAAKSRRDKRSIDDKIEPDEDEVTEGADQLEKDLCNLVATENIEGLEKLMESIKGIPGRAALRKNAKKALKKLRLANTPEQTTDANAALPIPNIPGNSNVPQQPATRTAARVLTPDITSAPPSDPNGYLQIISHVHNKPASQCATPGSQHVNSVRSRSNSVANTNGPLKSECTMHVRPLIVGWMIGKGGQRIRDLMEESGARIWIDQDSMGPNDPRILYISGARKNVDIAIGLLQNLVVKYQPLPSPHTRQPTTPHSEKAIAASVGGGKGPGLPETQDIPALPLKQKNGPSTLSNMAATARLPNDGRSRQILSCDPRFVPLLIGRRGWTIKNIQDSTGAKVDIDQSSTPRKITISGLEENVDKAVRMVQDVLSYPHSQLHGVIENAEDGVNSDVPISDEPVPVDQDCSGIAQVSPPIQIDPNVSTKSVEVASNLPTPPSVSANVNKIPGHSPPSSLIMTGDAKSTISASSSLSSTPEPVLISGSHAQVPSIDLNQTTFPLQQSRDLFSASGGLQQGTFNQATRRSPLPQASIFQSLNGNTFFGSLDQNYQHMQPDSPQHAINSPMALHSQINRPTFLPDQSSAFLSVHGQTQIPTHHPGQPPNQNLFGMGHLPLHNSTNETVRQSDPAMAAVGSGFWNGIGVPQTNPMHVRVDAISNDGFKLHAAAVDFLEHSQQIHSNPIPSVSDINDVLGLSMPPPAAVEQTLNSTQDPLLHFPKGRDDAQMVDSLFGPTLAAVPSSATTDNLLSSLNGLSLRVDESSSRLWGNTDLLVNAGNLRANEDSTLFGGLAPQKSESRFVWEENGQF